MGIIFNAWRSWFAASSTRTVKHWKWCPGHREASAKTQVSLTKFLQSEVKIIHIIVQNNTNHRCLSQSEESKCRSEENKFSKCIIYSLLIEKCIHHHWNISSFHVFVCDFYPEISFFFGKSFPFLFLFIELSVLRYFAFHVVSNKQLIGNGDY